MALALFLASLLVAPAFSEEEVNLVTNGGFEASFDQGVAEGWTAVNLRGATFKENAKLGRIGGGLYGASHGKEDERTLRMSGKVNLVDIARHDMVSKIKAALGPDVITVVKLGPEDYFAGRPLEVNPYENGRKFADHCRDLTLKTGHFAHCYYGLNEPHMNDAGDLARVARFELGFTERLHEHGMRSVVLNHSTGTPGPKENMYLPQVRELLAVADYVGYHSYGGPAAYSEGGQVMCGEKSLDDFSLRWREFAAEYERRGWRFPPMIYTEGTTWGGWTDNKEINEDIILDDLLCFYDKMMEDEWVVGMCVFATGAWPGQIWQKWDITRYPKIIEGVREYNLAYPVDAHTGTNAQQIVGAEGRFDGAVVQAVETEAGESYRLDARIKWEFTGGLARKTRIHVGWDPTGQTENAEASTVKWAADFVASGKWDTDIWYPVTDLFVADGDRASLWFRAVHTTQGPMVRVSLDDVRLVKDQAPPLEPVP